MTPHCERLEPRDCPSPVASPQLTPSLPVPGGYAALYASTGGVVEQVTDTSGAVVASNPVPVGAVLPSLQRMQGQIELSWEQGTALYFAMSADGGLTFGPPTLARDYAAEPVVAPALLAAQPAGLDVVVVSQPPHEQGTAHHEEAAQQTHEDFVSVHAAIVATPATGDFAAALALSLSQRQL